MGFRDVRSSWGVMRTRAPRGRIAEPAGRACDRGPPGRIRFRCPPEPCRLRRSRATAVTPLSERTPHLPIRGPAPPAPDPDSRCASRTMFPRSSTWPLGQARTKRVGTTDSFSKRPRSSRALRCTRRRDRSRCSLPDCRPPSSCTTNHSGNRHAPMPLRAAQGSLGLGGGAQSRGAGTPVMRRSLCASLVSTTSSSPFDQVSRPPMIAECLGRSMSAPGP